MVLCSTFVKFVFEFDEYVSSGWLNYKLDKVWNEYIFGNVNPRSLSLILKCELFQKSVQPRQTAARISDRQIL